MLSLFLVVQGSTLATKYSAKLARSFRLSKYIVGFIIIAFISILPETLISVNSAIAGVPEFGLGTLFGSNVADLTLIFALLIIINKRGMKIQSKILKNISIYPFFLLLPLILGLDGYYSKLEGIFLIIAGVLFYYMVFKKSVNVSVEIKPTKKSFKTFAMLALAMALLLVGSYFAVDSAVKLSSLWAINPVLMGILVVSLGTTMPEFFFSLKSMHSNEDSLAAGDILGSVLADATIVVGVLAFISPFHFPAKIIYVTGFFMIVAALVLLNFMKSERVITKKEGYALLFFWISYVIVEFIISK